MSKIIEPKRWENFLEEFSERNRDRRARFQVFTHGEANEEEQEAHLENILLDKKGNETKVAVTRIDKSDEEDKRMTDTINNVHGISVQYETDRSENLLEFTDDRGNLTILRFESKLDGAS
jgi:GTP-binding protein EngB required for normal cell division